MNTPRIMIAGTHSNCGKTTVVCAILKALQLMGKKTISFKCGPDYIDPMFHTHAIGVTSRNLDLFMMGENLVKYTLANQSKQFEISIVEGVMGLYDGIGQTSQYSCAHIANTTATPTILVVNCKGMGVSVAALVKGFLEMEANTVAGVILNHISANMYPYYKEIIENTLKVRVLGYLPRNKEFALESRHLGLITPQEMHLLSQKLEFLGQTAMQTLDLTAMLEIANAAKPLEYTPLVLPTIRKKVRIAIARDKAFCFYYEDNLEVFRKLGAEIVPFSPLTDKKLPDNIHGLLLGGGYPELYAQELSDNSTMHTSIKEAIESGLPTIAECGGFMYLTKNITLGSGNYPLVGVLDTRVFLTNKLVRFGYVTLTANKDNLFCKKGRAIQCHEFHYSDALLCGKDFMATKSSGNSYPCVFATDTLFAGYPHLHFYSNIDWAVSYIKKCGAYALAQKSLKV